MPQATTTGSSVTGESRTRPWPCWPQSTPSFPTDNLCCTTKSLTPRCRHLQLAVTRSARRRRGKVAQLLCLARVPARGHYRNRGGRVRGRDSGRRGPRVRGGPVWLVLHRVRLWGPPSRPPVLSLGRPWCRDDVTRPAVLVGRAVRCGGNRSEVVPAACGCGDTERAGDERCRVQAAVDESPDTPVPN